MTARNSYLISFFVAIGDNEPPRADDLLEVVEIDYTNIPYEMWTRDQKDLIKRFIQFQIKYGKHNASIQAVMNLWRGAQLKAYAESPEKELAGDFPCLMDILTCEDMAFALFTLDNSEDDWKKKMDGDVNDKKLRYSCNTKYTSNRSGRREVGGVNEEGTIMYNTLADWVDEIKTCPAFSDLRKLCNVTAKEMGVISDVQESETSKFKRRMESQKARGVTVKKIKVRRSNVGIGMDNSLSDLVIPV